jgi:hypothetical protein
MKVDHVEPVRSLTPDRGAGIRTWLAIALPVAILGAVVVGGVLGRSPDGGPNAVVRSTAPAATDGAPAVVSNSATRAPVAQADRVDPARYDAAGFPADTLGLTVRSVAETLDRIRGGSMRQSVVAVAGWLTIRPSDGGCPIDGPSPASIALCPRDAILHDSPAPFLALQGGEMVRLRSPGIHLHAEAVPGRQVALLAERQYRGLGPTLLPVPVVMVGRVGDPRMAPCGPTERHCGERLSLERLIWVEGAWQEVLDLRVDADSHDAGLSPRQIRRRIDQAVPGAGVLLGESLVPRGYLATLDPIADAAVDPSIDGLVWYVRVLVRAAGPGGSYPRGVGWAVLDDATGEILAAVPARQAAATDP